MGPTWNPCIARCDRPATVAITYDPDDKGERRLPYCREHAAAFIRGCTIRKIPVRSETIGTPEDCTAYKDL